MKNCLFIAMVLSASLLQAQESETKDPAPETAAERPKAAPNNRDRSARDPRPDRTRAQETPKFEDIDTDESGAINQEEWIAHQVKTARERAERSFSFVDRDNSGDLSKEEIGAAMQRFRGGSGGRAGGPGKGGQGRPRAGKGAPDSGSKDQPKRPPLEE